MKVAAPKTIDYSNTAIAKRLQNLYNMRQHWFMAKGINRPEPKLIYALERLGAWVPKCKYWTIENLARKVNSSKQDIELILPSATGKQANFRFDILNDIQFCAANTKEVTV